mmetsp:Transcript_6087/g.13029  ORF Transcript_6087/g.13029 Transcript_6087/m.13029 type:complete len:263 (+) Transcript_6087:2-790(+)
MSLRSFARIGSSVSVLDFVNLGSTLSVRNLVRLGGDLSMVSGQALRMDNSYVKYASSSMMFYVGGSKAMTIESDGGILHGSWNTEASLVTSDRRMKKEIKPLQRTLRAVVQQDMAGTPSAPATQKMTGGTGSDGALWLLRQLRPVSYSFKKGAESKYMRFGFIADELESVVPQVVRTTGQGDRADQKAVVYQDLIALLASAAQSQQAEIESQRAAIESQLAAIEHQRAVTEELTARLEKMEQEERMKTPSKKRRRSRRRLRA